ncbi:DUF4097 family beta strand repeat-containing protein [Actinosynnema sp. NPDC020468]|uniref:DUF4097 family beta strand repeat-containing protein n=1 Tax=Actinosynnema sp. NPDC020468 TaxID=3154488 RepID=UPI0033F48238
MPIFDTPEPISATLELVVGDVRIIATDRVDTEVDVRPANPARQADVTAAEQTRVEFAHGALLVRTPKQLSFFTRPGTVDVVVALPAGSAVRGSSSLGDIRTEGRLGECRFKTASGHLDLDHTGALTVGTANGHVKVDFAEGDTSIDTGSGDITVGRIAGDAVIKNGNGDTLVREISGVLRVSTANGDIAVDRAHTDVTAKTANGDVRVAEVARGSVQLQTAVGDLEVGIRRGSAAYLDATSVTGRVRNGLGDASGPAANDETVEVRARTVSGDVVVRRSWLEETR